jgi:hypothetical protein
MTARKLNPLHAAFVAAILEDPDEKPGPAYERIYGPQKGGHALLSGLRLLRRPDVSAELARLKAERIERRGITAEETVREITLLAKADPRALFEVIRGACRYCHGAGHLYHRTPREFREAWQKHMADHPEDSAGLTFDHEGGVGFNLRTRPHPDCPECSGLGEVYEVIKDSRDWPDGAARLFSGLHRTKDGLKITMRSQDGALKLAAQMHDLLTRQPEDADTLTPPPTVIQYEATDAAKPGRKR